MYKSFVHEIKTLNTFVALLQIGQMSGALPRIQNYLYNSWTRNLFFIGCGSISVLLILSGYPFAPLFEESNALRAAFRIGFAAVFLVSLLRTRDAIPIVFGYDECSTKTFSPKIAVFYAQIFFTLLVLVGFVTEIAAILLLVSRIVFIEWSKRYGLANTVYQIVIVHLPFLGLGEIYSVDQLLGLHSWLASPVMFNSLFVAMGTMMLSGGYHKFESQLWLRGQAVKEFIKLPHIRFAPLRGRQLSIDDRLSTLFTYGMLLGELFLLVSVLNKYLFLGMLLLFTGFALSATVVTDLSFIGQVLLLVLGMFGGAVILFPSSYPALTALTTPTITRFSVLALLLNGLSVLILFRPDIVLGTRLRTVCRWLSGHNAPVKPFNEHHFFGIYTYRLAWVDPETNGEEPVFETFDADGWQNKMFLARYYETSVLVLADYCLGVLHDDVPQQKETDIIDLCYAGLLEAGESSGKIKLYTKVYEGDVAEYLNREWQEIGVCEFTEYGATWEQTNEPPRVEDHPRLSFSDELKNA